MKIRHKIFFLFLATIFSARSAFSTDVFSDSIFAKMKMLKQDTAKVNLLNKTAWAFARKGELEKGFFYADSSRKLSEKIDYKTGEGKAYNTLGVISWNKGDFNNALILLEKAFQFRKETGDKKGVASVLNNIGLIYRSQGNYSRAIETFLQTLTVRQELGNDQDISSSLNNIGLVYDDLGEIDKAFDFYTRSLTYAERANDKGAIAAQYNNLAIILRKKGDLKKALEYQNKALAIRLEIGDRQGVSRSYGNMGVIYEYLNNFPLALDYDLRSLKIDEEVGDKPAITLTLHNVAEVYFQQKKYPEAIANATRGLKLADAINSQVDIKELNFLLSSIYEALHDYDKAYPYYKKYIMVRDSLYSKEKTREVMRSEMNFDYEKKKQADKLIQEKKDALTEADEHKQSLIIYFGAGILLLVIIFALFVFRSNREKGKANAVLEEKNLIIEEKNKSITDSINYANRIQQAIFPAKEIKYRNFPDSFVLFRPRDIVSGDFYWFAEKNGKRFMAAVDCTGHGVPGAFMSMIGNSLLNQIVIEKGISSPAEILNQLNSGIITSLKQYETDTHDGMDIALLCFDEKGVLFAGANRPLVIISDGKISEVKPDKNSIGGMQGIENKIFSEKRIEVNKNDVLYIFSDGYADQFGGPKGKKFKYRNMQELFMAIHKKKMQEQETILLQKINEWKNNLEQVDDILVIGIRV